MAGQNTGRCKVTIFFIYGALFVRKVHVFCLCFIVARIFRVCPVAYYGLLWQALMNRVFTGFEMRVVLRWIVKHGKTPPERPCFAMRKAAFQRVKGGLLKDTA